MLSFRPESGRIPLVLAGAFLVFCLLVGQAGAGAAADRGQARQLFDEANAAYQAGRYDEAERGYAAVAALGLESAELYFNRGNANLRQGRLGPAILNFKRALRLDPGLDDATANLAYARRRTVDSQATAGEDPFPWLTRLRPGPERASTLFLLLLNASALLFAGRRLWRGGPPVLGSLFGLAAMATLFAGLLFVLERRADDAAQEAVVQAPSVEARSGPGEENTVAFVVHEGTEVRVVRESNGWIEIGLGTELKGWVPPSSVERVQ